MQCQLAHASVVFATAVWESGDTHEYRSVSLLLPNRHEGSWLGSGNYLLISEHARGGSRKRGNYAAGFLRGLPRRGVSGDQK